MDLPEPDRAGFVELNRSRLRVWEWGDPDAPPVICAHGAYDHGRMWDGIAPRLAALGYRVLCPDLRGHGDSGRLSSGATWQLCSLDLGLLARHVGGPVGWIGHSFGGGQVLYVGGVWPELARWVVNLDGLGPPAAAFSNEFADLPERVARSFDNLRRLRTSPPRVYATQEEMAERRAAVNVRLPRQWVEHLVRHGSAAVEGGFVWKADPLFTVGFPGDFEMEHLLAEYEMVRCPVLVLTGGEHDTWSDLSEADLAERLAVIPDHRHHVIADAGHYVHIEQPDAVLAAVGEFVSEVDGR